MVVDEEAIKKTKGIFLMNGVIYGIIFIILFIMTSVSEIMYGIFIFVVSILASLMAYGFFKKEKLKRYIFTGASAQTAFARLAVYLLFLPAKFIAEKKLKKISPQSNQPNIGGSNPTQISQNISNTQPNSVGSSKSNSQYYSNFQFPNTTASKTNFSSINTSFSNISIDPYFKSKEKNKKKKAKKEDLELPNTFSEYL